MLVSLLYDPDAEIQTEAVRAVSDLKIPNVVAELIKRLDKVDSTVQEEICIALGRFNDRAAVPALVHLLQSKSSFWKKTTATTDTVRFRVIWAMGQLLPNAEADNALQRVLKDPVGMVQRAAHLALQKTSAPSRQAA